MDKYLLMNKDSKVLEFYPNKDMTGKYKVCNIINKDMLPLIIKSNVENFNKWIRDRIVPKNRQYIDSIMSSIKQDKSNIVGILLTNNGCSLNDSYWIKSIKSASTWSDVNLYNNILDECIQNVTLLGNEDYITTGATAPDITTDGSVGKAWKIDSNSIYLYKRDNIGKESYSEVVASRICNLLKLEFIEYKTEEYKDVRCSVCKLYTSEDLGYLTFSDYLRYKEIPVKDVNITNVQKLVPEYYTQFINDMIVFDYIIENRDRHFRNFGFKINNNFQNLLGEFPIFDNGYSLLNNKSAEQISNLNYSSYSEIGTFNITNRQQLEYTIHSNGELKPKYKRWAELIIINMEEILYGLPEEFLENVKRLLKNRCNNIIKLTE